jgi:hypothetical protein
MYAKLGTLLVANRWGPGSSIDKIPNKPELPQNLLRHSHHCSKERAANAFATSQATFVSR